MKIKIQFTHEQHGTHEVVTMPADLLQWERLTKSKMTDLITNRNIDGEVVTQFSIGYEDLMAMAWAVMTRRGETSDKFQSWVNGLQDIEFGGVDETQSPKVEASHSASPNLSHQEL